MTRDILIAISLMAAGTGAACTPMARVPVSAATPADLERLVGNWAGEYESPALGRQGRIEFKLAANATEAYGDIVMIPRGQTSPYQPEPSQPGLENMHVLTIRFIRAANGSVRGMLDRYWDPDRVCYAAAIFQGYVERAVVSGSFTTTCDSGAGEAKGTWHVERTSARRQP